MQRKYEYLQVDRQEGVAVVYLDRPERRNALIDPMTHELRDALRTLAHAESVNALVLTGRAGNFTAGGDLDMLHLLHGEALEDPTDVTRRMRENATVIEELLGLPFPSVAAIDGACAGAGMGWAAACSVRIGTERTTLNTAYLDLGLGTDFGTAAMLTRLLGPSIAADWTLRPRRIDAAEAHARGYLGQLVPHGELLDRAIAIATEWATATVGAHAIIRSIQQASDGIPLGTILDDEAASFVESLNSEPAGRRLDRSTRPAPSRK
jgi:2-(1,2-epoxy-1,2-dihydrophenyl)acetyl-CoA isomerase